MQKSASRNKPVKSGLPNLHVASVVSHGNLLCTSFHTCVTLQHLRCTYNSLPADASSSLLLGWMYFFRIYRFTWQSISKIGPSKAANPTSLAGKDKRLVCQKCSQDKPHFLQSLAQANLQATSSDVFHIHFYSVLKYMIYSHSCLRY